MAQKKAVTTADIKVADPVEDGYTVLVSPVGVATTVPDGIVEALIESGYSKK